MSSFKSSETILKRVGQTVQFRINKFFSVIMNEMAMKPKGSLAKAVNLKTDIDPNGVRIVKTCLEYMGLNIYFLISQNISADLKGPKDKYKLHYGRCTWLLFRAATQHNTSCSDNTLKYKSELL